MISVKFLLKGHR